MLHCLLLGLNASLICVSSSFTENSATGSGGAVELEGLGARDDVVFTRCVFTGNSSGKATGVY